MTAKITHQNKILPRLNLLPPSCTFRPTICKVGAHSRWLVPLKWLLSTNYPCTFRAKTHHSSHKSPLAVVWLLLPTVWLVPCEQAVSSVTLAFNELFSIFIHWFLTSNDTSQLTNIQVPWILVADWLTGCRSTSRWHRLNIKLPVKRWIWPRVSCCQVVKKAFISFLASWAALLKNIQNML